MVMVARSSETGNGGGAGRARDIGRMFRTQEDKLREWTVYDPTPIAPILDSTSSSAYVIDTNDDVMDIEEVNKEKGVEAVEVVEELIETSDPVAISLDSDADAWEEEDEDESQRCHLCGHIIPIFAILAHERFHSVDD
ncbi:hypothetical protein PC116_g32560 [Phytophthora cactorum]|nr:hypothetical protein PC116_g32560 [Phytophthora cactorum]